jgi:hypothetical protein
MRRRNFLLCLTATAGLAACTRTTDGVAAAPILASTTASSLAPKSITPYVPGGRYRWGGDAGRSALSDPPPFAGDAHQA